MVTGQLSKIKHQSCNGEIAIAISKVMLKGHSEDAEEHSEGETAGRLAGLSIPSSWPVSRSTFHSPVHKEILVHAP